MSKKSNSSRFYRCCYALFAGAIKLIFRIRVINPENEPDEGGYLICSNHISAADAVIMCYTFKKNQARIMAKKELFKIPFLAQLIKLLGAFPVDRRGSDVGAIKKAISMIEEGSCVGIFPQGHRHPGVDPRTTPIKNGAGLIASRAECDILPMYILRKDNRPKLFRKTYVVLGSKIPYSEISAMGDNGEITRNVFDRICTLGECARENSDIRL